LLFAETKADDIAERLAGVRLVFPKLLMFELVNVCVIKSRRYPDLLSALVAAFTADRM
jgi:hypothetical protein